MSWRDQSPDIHSPASLLLIFSPLSFTSPPTVSSDFYCQQLGIREHLSEAPVPRAAL